MYLCWWVQVTGVLGQVAEAYGVSLVEGVLSHQLKQFVIDGNKCVLNKASPEYRVEDGEFEENEVYGIDIVVSAIRQNVHVLCVATSASCDVEGRKEHSTSQRYCGHQLRVPLFGASPMWAEYFRSRSSTMQAF